MSGYRPIYKKIWKDPDFQELPPEDKLLFLYLCTNEATNESGIYQITTTTISNETNINNETVRQRLDNGCLKNIAYDNVHKVVFVKKLRKYNTGGKPDLIVKAIEKEQKNCPHYFWLEFVELYPEYKGLANGWTTVVQPSDNDTIIYNDNIINIYGEFNNVSLSEKEKHKLIEKFGEDGFKARVEKLSAGIASKGYKYKSHYATILSWEFKDIRDGKKMVKNQSTEKGKHEHMVER